MVVGCRADVLAHRMRAKAANQCDAQTEFFV